MARGPMASVTKVCRVVPAAGAFEPFGAWLVFGRLPKRRIPDARWFARPCAESAEKGASHVVPLARDALQLGRRLGQRHIDDLVAVEGRHASEPPLEDEVGGLEPVAVGEHRSAPVRVPARLDVAKDLYRRLL